jgi:[acyl-carrier-protein] S-malonyltransferase
MTATEETEPAAIRAIMARQIVSRVRGFEIINSLVARGVNTFIEVGPQKVLTGLTKKTVLKSSEFILFQIDTPESLANCLDAIGVD